MKTKELEPSDWGKLSQNKSDWIKRRGNSKLPEKNREIECLACDWSQYYMVGKFIPYSKSGPMSGKSRFCVDGIEAKDKWYDVEFWRYLK